MVTLMRSAVVALAACGGSTADGRADALAVDSQDVATPACDVTKPFGTPIPVADVNTTDNDTWGWQTSDQRTIYFARFSIGFSDGDLYVATRAQQSDVFTGAVPLDGVNTANNERRPILTADGLTLYAEATPNNDADIKVATRASTSASFSALTSIPEINSTSVNDFNPWISDDGLTLYFTSSRNGSHDIFKTIRTSGGVFDSPVAVDELNTNLGDYMGALSEDGLEIVFASRRNNAGANDDIFHATRSTRDEPFGVPTMLADLSGATTDDYPTWISADRCQLMFSSDRPDGSGGYDIWIATRPK